tara:strand:- start:383 stop:1003 length:621 start_codon:yes stop_codon:yes gene_type:complete
MKKICVIDYGVNNISSICKALKKINEEYEVVSEKDQIKDFSNIILPGVGSFDSGMNVIKNKGFDISLKKAASNGQFILGICLGMQLLFNKSEESIKNIDGLNIIKGNVSKIRSDNSNNIYVPHVGWNSIFESNTNDINLLKKDDKKDFYFVNSYYVIPENKDIIKYYFRHGKNYPAIIKDKNVIATQFHPEKSINGLIILKKFCSF